MPDVRQCVLRALHGAQRVPDGVLSVTTAIEWTDETWNPVTGCTKVSPGCKFCYAERVADRFWLDQYPLVMDDQEYRMRHRRFTDVQIHADRLDKPLRWRGQPRRVFVNSMSDLFHEAVPDEFIGRVFGVMRGASEHAFQILTKRPERMRQFVAWYGEGPWPCEEDRDRWPLPNVWLGVSAEDQERADERIPLLLQTPAAVRFLSVEPLLGPVDLTKWLPFFFPFPGELRRLGEERATQTNDDGSVLVQMTDGGIAVRPALNWVIVGGESGGSPERALVERCETSVWANVHRANRDACEGCGGTGWSPKPEALAWVRALRDQCVGAGVPFFFKQWGGVTPKAGGCILDGKVWHEFPDGPGRR